MATLSIRKPNSLLGMMTKDGTNYLDRIAIFERYEDPPGSGEYAYSLIDTIKTITWTNTAGIMTADVDFEVPAGKVVAGVMLFDSTDKAGGTVANGDEIIRYFFTSPYSYVVTGLFRIDNLALVI